MNLQLFEGLFSGQPLGGNSSSDVGRTQSEVTGAPVPAGFH